MSFDPPIPLTVDDYAALPMLDSLSEAIDRATIPAIIGPEHKICPLVPNICDWHAGDVLLIQPGARHRLSPVRFYQFLLTDVPKGTSAYTHVGVYDGFGHIWEANPSYNIRMSTVSSVLGTQACFRLFRLKDAEIDRDRLVDICRFLRDTQRYPSYIEFVRPQILVKLGARLLKRGNVKLTGNMTTTAESLVCSTFAFHALSIAASRSIQINTPFIVPADFASPEVFDPVDVSWRRAAKILGL